MDDETLEGTAALFGEDTTDDGTINYGPLILTVAPKEGKANTLLADHLFSPSLVLAEYIERGIISLGGKTVLELGAGCALPSLLASTRSDPPALVVITDYPDHTILDNLDANVKRNSSHVAPGCTVQHQGYEWGADVSPLLEISRQRGRPDGRYDILILSDLLHFDRSHDVLLTSLTSLLCRNASARAYVAAGKYTSPEICERFVRDAQDAGIALCEQAVDAEAGWLGELLVSGGGLDVQQLAVRKGMVRYWVGQWISG